MAHRVELLSLADDDAADDGAALWGGARRSVGAGLLLYPNGVDTYETPSCESPEGVFGVRLVLCADWNSNCVYILPGGDEPDCVRIHTFGGSDGGGGGGGGEGGPSDGKERFNRPADVAIERVDGRRVSDQRLAAVADFYGGAVRLFSASHGFGYVGSLRRGRGKRGAKLKRPSGVAWDPSSGLLVVAESGARRLSIFRVDVTIDAAVASAAISRLDSSNFDEDVSPPTIGTSARSVHICDVCTDQLGSSVHVPLKGAWAWLAVDVSNEGEVYVADMDNACVHVV